MLLKLDDGKTPQVPGAAPQVPSETVSDNVSEAASEAVSEAASEVPPQAPADSEAASQAPEGPAFITLDKHSRMTADLFRALLALLSLVVAAGLVLVLLPQPAVDRMADGLRARHGIAPPEKIAFLYLGDNLKGTDFLIRGVVRNISPVPIEKLDAAVRFYAHDGTTLETTVVRMSTEAIDPGQIARFELLYPNYSGEFGSYSVEFKLRQGPLIPYKDMRATRAEPVKD